MPRDIAIGSHARAVAVLVVVSLYAFFWDSSNCNGYLLATPVSATPLPAAIPLFATGLGGIGLLARRRKWKPHAVA